MKIGEFAKACGVTISVLRYYDGCGLLKPVYIDRFTGYRYYSECQIAVCGYISELKAAGFSLAEIKPLISGSASPEEINAVFENKKKQLNDTLRRIDDIYSIISGGNFMPKETIKLMREDVNIPFENDERIIGLWEIIGEYDSRTEFDLGKRLNEDEGGQKRYIYFLPEGRQYWVYSWTKGKLLFNNGDVSFVNDYTVEKHSDGLYMFVKFKSYDYLQSGRKTLLVLRQCDNIHYEENDIAKKDNIDMPFVNDENVLGKWKAISFVKHKEEFMPEKIESGFNPFFKEIDFLPEGECVSIYGDKVISGRNTQEWTKGYVLRKWNSTACAYEIRNIDGTEYMFMEWKSGDYRLGGFEAKYYVFAKT